MSVLRKLPPTLYCLFGLLVLQAGALPGMVLCLGEEHDAHLFISLVPCHVEAEHAAAPETWHEDEEAHESHHHTGEEDEHDCPCPDDCSSNGCCIDIFLSLEGERNEQESGLHASCADAAMAQIAQGPGPARFDGGLRELPSPARIGPSAIHQTQRFIL